MHALSPCKGPIGSVFNFIKISLCALGNNRQSMETQSDNKSKGSSLGQCFITRNQYFFELLISRVLTFVYKLDNHCPISFALRD